MSRQRAIVIGGSVAGLLAGLAAAEHYDEVIVIERDELDAGFEARKGVPQGKHVHALLSAGLSMASEFVPDLKDQLLAKGCCVTDPVRDVPFMGTEGWRVRVASKVKTIGFRRPIFESTLRENLLRLQNSNVRVGAVESILSDGTRHTVIGVRLRGGERLESDLVIDATGRGSKAGRWMEELGYPAPDEMHVRVFLGYATQLVRVPEDALLEEIRGVAAVPHPGHTRGGVLLEVDGGLHMLTAIGMARDYPPGDRVGLLSHCDLAPAAVFGEIARRCEPMSDIATYRMPGNQRRLWEAVARRPKGFLVTGDAVASFNPVYGQGMTQAMQAAITLRDCLSESDDDRTLPTRFQMKLSSSTADAFAVSSTADSAYEGAEMIGFTPPDEETVAYFVKLEQLATEDPVVSAELFASHFEQDPDRLLSDEMKARVKAWIEEGSPIKHSRGNSIPPVVHMTARG
jgi:2-polyprenyl-6-methoxyphenol hydroxylase-like FAD-dependent oxidoreductase